MDQIILKGTSIQTLVAISPEDHAQGLMFQLWPPPIMSFPYRKAEVRKFWMKNCPSPLDIVFAHNNQIIEIVTGHPYSERHIGPELPSDLVVEMPKGMARELKIQAGDSIIFRPSIKTLAGLLVSQISE